MITGFNTDVKHDGQVYHVQTEDRGQDNPVLESLVYVGGTIVAKKMTPYADKLQQGADEQAIAGLLKRQHQVIIAAIKAGRVEELVNKYAGPLDGPDKTQDKAEGKRESKPEDKPRTLQKPEANGHAAKPSRSNSSELAANGAARVTPAPAKAAPSVPLPAVNNPEPARAPDSKPKRNSGPLSKRNSGKLPPLPPQARSAPPAPEKSASRGNTSMLGSPKRPEPPPAKPASPAHLQTEPRNTTSTARRATGTLDLDQVINEYLKRSNEQGKLDLKVITPSVFIAGKSVGLRIQVLFNATAEADAVVTIKIIGTAFKPQVFIGRAGRDGVANFSLALPAFTAGTAAIVIEAQSNRGRGELKHLIRRA